MIDTQHRQLIDAINRLLEACTQGKGRQEIAPVMKFLSDYTTKHFFDEEQLQLKTKYPDYANHKRYHEEFKRVVAGIAKEFETQGASVALVAKVNHSIAGWLINHIKREDVKVAAHVKSMN